MQALSSAIKEKNLKVTPQRLAILTLLKNTTKHPSAETIFRALSPDFPNMSLATVYKTLGAFKTAGLIQELNVGEDCFHYDANAEPHPHLVCNTCRKIFDYEKRGVLDDLKREVEENCNFSVTGEQIYFFGQCQNCR